MFFKKKIKQNPRTHNRNLVEKKGMLLLSSFYPLSDVFSASEYKKIIEHEKES